MVFVGFFFWGGERWWKHMYHLNSAEKTLHNSHPVHRMGTGWATVHWCVHFEPPRDYIPSASPNPQPWRKLGWHTMWQHGAAKCASMLGPSFAFLLWCSSGEIIFLRAWCPLYVGKGLGITQSTINKISFCDKTRQAAKALGPCWAIFPKAATQTAPGRRPCALYCPHILRRAEPTTQFPHVINTQ